MSLTVKPSAPTSRVNNEVYKSYSDDNRAYIRVSRDGSERDGEAKLVDTTPDSKVTAEQLCDAINPVLKGCFPNNWSEKDKKLREGSKVDLGTNESAAPILAKIQDAIRRSFNVVN